MFSVVRAPDGWYRRPYGSGRSEHPPNHVTVTPELQLSTREEVRLPLRWLAILHGRAALSLAATSGVQTDDDVVKLLLAGADVVMVASQLLRKGPVLIRELTDGLGSWLDEREYASVEQMKGSMSQLACGNPRAFERAQYVRALVGFSPGQAERAQIPGDERT